MRVIRMSEHVGCARVPSMLENTRTVFTAAPLRLLAWNMAYHTAHHALPQAPFFQLGALDAVLRAHVVETRDGYVDFRAHPLSQNGPVTVSPGGGADDVSRCDGRA